jgi:hypothetical protein
MRDETAMATADDLREQALGLVDNLLADPQVGADARSMSMSASRLNDGRMVALMVCTWDRLPALRRALGIPDPPGETKPPDGGEGG